MRSSPFSQVISDVKTDLQFQEQPRQAGHTVTPIGSISFDIKMVKTSGVPGDEINQCSYVYTVSRIWSYDESGNPEPTTLEQLAENVNPTAAPHHHQRPPVGGMIQATLGTARIVKINGIDVFKLIDVNEQVDQEKCDDS